MPLTIPVAHDFICPWCWVALFQAKRLEEEFDVRIEWKGYELFPVDLEWPDAAPTPPPPANKPPVPSRLDFILIADGVELPTTPRPHKMRTNNAHQAVEFAKTEGKGNEYVERLYRALWEDGKEINNPEVLKQLAEGLIEDIPGLGAAIAERHFANEVVGFDDEAYSKGVYNVPTYFIGDERYAEQPYAVLRKAVQKQLEA